MSSASTAADAVAGEDEDPRLAGERLQLAVARSALSSARTTVVPTAITRPPRGARARDLLDQRRADVEPLAVHHVLARSSTRTGWNVPAPTCRVTWPNSHAARAQRLQQRLVEMQAGGRRGDRAELAREHGLVALVVVAAGLALDVRRQRQAAGVQQQRFERLVGVETQLVELAVAAEHFGFAAVVEQRSRLPAFGDLLAPICARAVVRAEQALEQDLDAAAGVLVRRTAAPASRACR